MSFCAARLSPAAKAFSRDASSSCKLAQFLFYVDAGASDLIAGTPFIGRA
jgi:hypothetical protein